MWLKYFLVISFLWSCSARSWYDKLNYIIACHTTDFVCFKRQYQSLRDHVLLGNKLLMIPRFESVIYEHERSSTCVNVHGLEYSKLTSISFDSFMDTKGIARNELVMTWDMPIKMIQIKAYMEKCHQSTFNSTELDLLYDFAANATLKATFPFTIDDRKKRETYLNLLEEELDFELEIADVTSYKNSGIIEEENEYISTIWAEEVLKDFDVAAELGLPFTSNLHTFTSKVPLEKYLLLYPEENYHNLHFSFGRNSTVIWGSE